MKRKKTKDYDDTDLVNLLLGTECGAELEAKCQKEIDEIETQIEDLKTQYTVEKKMLESKLKEAKKKSLLVSMKNKAVAYDAEKENDEHSDFYL